MPGLDRTGPQGVGSRTGGARGLCDGTSASNALYGRRCGGGYAHHGEGRHMGLGYAKGAALGVNRETFLKDEAASLKNRLDFIQKELDNIATTDIQSNESES